MMELRRTEDRGVAEHGWLSSRHSFSFGHYYDPAHMGFGPLRVINEDIVQAGQGFGTHGHSNMEIISYVLGGALEHRDSIGTASVIRYGHVQRMSAGTGVRHSEFNHSRNEPVHFLQIWIIPNRQGIEPGYEERFFAQASKEGQWRLIASATGRDGSVLIHQDADVYAAIVGEGDTLEYSFAPSRIGYLHVALGSASVNGHRLKAGDAMKLVDEPRLSVSNGADAEILLFDLPM